MVMIWSTRGVPRMIHTSVRVSQRKGVKRLMEPKEITSPRGTAPMMVMKKSCRVLRKPLLRAATTVWNSWEVKNIGSSSLWVVKGRGRWSALCLCAALWENYSRMMASWRP